MSVALLLGPALLLILAGLLDLARPVGTRRGAGRRTGASLRLAARGAAHELDAEAPGTSAQQGASRSTGGSAVAAVLAGVTAGAALWQATASGVRELPLYAWSPLGLYGVTLSLRLDPVPLTAAVVAPVAAAMAAIRRGLPSGTGSEGDSALAPGFFAAGATWLLAAAGDLVALMLVFTALSLAVAGWVWMAAGGALGRRTLVAGNAAGVCLLLASLSLARANGSVAYSQLSPSTFGPATAVLLFAALLFAVGAVPSCRWLAWLLGRGPATAAIAVGVAGSAALALALRAFSLAGGDVAARAAPLPLLGGSALVVAGAIWAGVAAGRRVAAGALLVWLGQVLLALSADTPAVAAAGLLYGALQALGLAGLLLARGWVALALLATVAAVPGTAGALALSWLAGSAAAAGRPGWWSLLLLSSQLLLLVPLAGLARSSVLAALGGRPQTADRGAPTGPEPYSASGDTGVSSEAELSPTGRTSRPEVGTAAWLTRAVAGAALILGLVGPVLALREALGPWRGAVLTSLQGRSPLEAPLQLVSLPPLWVTGAVCLLLAALRPPALLLPSPAAGRPERDWRRLRMAGVTGRRRARRLGAALTPRRTVDRIAARGTALIERVLSMSAPVEERYYAAAALLLAVLLLYVVGR